MPVTGRTALLGDIESGRSPVGAVSEGKMKDGYGRTISYLRVSVTDLCNLRCQYCMPEEGVEKKEHARILTLEEIAEIVEEAAKLGIKKVRITGGEPLVRRGIISLCENIARTPGIEETVITTNGILLDKMAKDLYNAGIRRVNISLDTLNPDKYRKITRKGDLNKVFLGIKKAKETGFNPIKINTVLMGGFNDDEIDDFVEFARKNEVEVRFIELMPVGCAAAFEKNSFITCDSIRDKFSNLIPCGNSGVARVFEIPGSKGKIGLITPESHEFCSECDRIRLTSDGKIKPCLHSEAEISVKGLHGESLAEKLKEAIMAKPLRHLKFSPGEATAGGRSMNRIGG